MATHSSILAWRIPWTEELGGLQSTGRKESDTTERLHSLSGFIVYILKLSVYLQMMLNHFMYQFSLVQSVSCVRLFVTL